MNDRLRGQGRPRCARRRSDILVERSRFRLKQAVEIGVSVSICHTRDEISDQAFCGGRLRFEQLLKIQRQQVSVLAERVEEPAEDTAAFVFQSLHAGIIEDKQTRDALQKDRF